MDETPWKNHWKKPISGLHGIIVNACRRSPKAGEFATGCCWCSTLCEVIDSPFMSIQQKVLDY